MKVAIVHDWLYTYAGAERVLEQILALWPEADVFSLIDRLPMEMRGMLGGRPVHTSFLQHWPHVARNHRIWLPFFPFAIEQFDLTDYDLIISSSYAVAKGVMAGPLQKHLCYCHSPMRYAWDMQAQYLRESGMDHGLKGMIARIILHYIRLWDVASNARVDQFVANSSFVRSRIHRCYGRNAKVVHPPVDTDFFRPGGEKGDSYVVASRMVAYKKIDLIVQAFSAMPEKHLTVIGEGPGMARIQRLAGPNVELLGFQEHEVLRSHLQRARAFVFAAEEDFGIAPLEAQACGTPVIAFGKGGVCDSVIPLGNPAPTGLFYDEQTVPSLQDAVRRFEENQVAFLPENCRRNAERFAPEIFRTRFRSIADRLMKS